MGILLPSGNWRATRGSTYEADGDKCLAVRQLIGEVLIPIRIAAGIEHCAKGGISEFRDNSRPIRIDRISMGTYLGSGILLLI